MSGKLSGSRKVRVSPAVRLQDGNLWPFGPTEVGVVDPRDLVNPAGRSLLAQGQVSRWSSSQVRLLSERGKL